MDPLSHSSHSPPPPPSPRHPPTRTSLQHAPLNPSQLRESAFVPSSPQRTMSRRGSDPDEDEDKVNDTNTQPAGIDGQGGHPFSGDHTEPIDREVGPEIRGRIVEPSRREVNARTRLLENYDYGHVCGSGQCGHGTFSPHVDSLMSGASSISSGNGFGGRYSGGINEEGGPSSAAHRWLGDAFTDGVMGGGRDSKMSTTKWLAKKHGLKNRKTM